MNIRKMKYTDIQAVCLFEEKQMFPDRWNYSQFADSLLSDKYTCFIAEDENTGEILGTVAINFSLEEADLVNVLVAHKLRRTGLGSTLIEKVFEMCREIELKKLFLEVRESNLPAIKMYLKFGFKKISQRKKYYSDGETAIIMVKDFSYV